MTGNKLESLRKAMANQKIDAYIIPTTDPHQSEYIPEYWKTRQWLTGFTGSAGVAVVTKNQAGLWVDDRYFIQAEAELNPPIMLFKQKTRNPEYIDWLYANLNFGDTVGIDGQLFSASIFEKINKKLSSKQIKTILVGDLFEKIWTDRPSLPDDKIFIHEDSYAGESRREKIDNIVSLLKLKEANYLIVTTLDDIAWLLNLRGSDIPFNPLFMAYCLISPLQTYLFIDESKLTDEIRSELKKDKITTLPYKEIYKTVSQIKEYTSVLVDNDCLSESLMQMIPNQCKIVAENNLIAKYKSVKNETQIEHYRQIQKFDGVAMCNFLNWLEKTVPAKTLTELEVAGMMEKFRSEQPEYMGLSFPVISAYQANAALPHYLPGKRSNVDLKPSGIYLVDCGSQYKGGTTDITRTVRLGNVDQEIIDSFTLVLKAHIALATAVFPIGTKGYQLDALARNQLWKHGFDYGHGSGHGIGFYLNVHEGPQGFAIQANGPAGKVIEPGIMITNEPGVYFEGKFGIRTENVMLCIPAFRKNEIEFLKFETLSFCPIDKSLINTNLLTNDELNWINQYHKQVFEALLPLVSQEVKEWLQPMTSPIN
jgi:Xaa-Pro aminopeptidase